MSDENTIQNEICKVGRPIDVKIWPVDSGKSLRIPPVTWDVVTIEPKISRLYSSKKVAE